MKYTKTVLDNGLRIITVPMKDNPAITVLVLVEAGSKYETKQNNGISHCLEHMCFKGTIKRPKALDIAREFDQLGALNNAFTSHEHTGYYAKAGYRQLDKVVDLLSDIYLHSTFGAAELAREKGVIIEEINMYEDSPQDLVWNLLYETLYGDQPAGWDVIGTKELITGFQSADLVNYHQKHYVASATTVVVAGEFDEAKVLALVKEKFAAVSTAEAPTKRAIIENQTEPVVAVKSKITDQAHLVLAVRTFDRYQSEKNYQLAILASLLGGGMSSRLFQKIREELGAAYYVFATPSAYTDHGFLALAAGADKSRVKEIVTVMINECHRLKDELVSETELQQVKGGIIGRLDLRLETSQAVANFYGGQEVHREKIENIDEQIKQLSKVTANEIQKLAQEIFHNDRLNLVVVGNGYEAAKLKPLLDLS